MLNWITRFNIFCLLDNHQYQSNHHSQECLLGAGALDMISAEAGNAFDQLKDFTNNSDEWFFGHFSFDLKAETEHIPSAHPDRIRFPCLFFFKPEFVVEIQVNRITIGSYKSDHQFVYDAIQNISIDKHTANEDKISIQSVFSRQQYIETVEALRRHILHGDCYEINFCQEFFAEGYILDPASTYKLLSTTSPTPFAAFYRCNENFLFCASPERYLSRKGDSLVSQPIKGTWPRNFADPEKDIENKKQLYLSAKDRAENVMVVDLVRNDLSKVCTEGSVEVEELYGIYSFPQVHQMISTITGTQIPGLHWTDIIKATFPMGSMTGAPKKKVLELIEKYEKSSRGLYSGAVGYISPGGDFDFNVVIRSILYNEATKTISYQVGAGITFYSNAENEYEECLLKASAIKKVLEARNN